MPAWLDGVWRDIQTVFVEGDRYKLFLNGLGVTLKLSFFALLIGTALGLILALMRLSKFKPAAWLSGLYIDIIRGTPMVVQLMILYFVVFGSVKSTNPNFKVLVGSVAFGMNSGAYVAEIIRAGILSIDHGQTEAGRSLGLSSGATLRLIVIPQALKNVIPALCNEAIVLIKETSVFGYIGGVDLAKVGEQVRTKTFMALLPLLAVAVIYYVVVKILSVLVQKLERRLRESDRR